MLLLFLYLFEAGIINLMSTEHTEQPARKKFYKNRRVHVIAAGVLVLLLVVLAAFWFMQQLYTANLQRIDASKYQVVYLVNGQAYFGKLQNANGEYLVMKSPYTAQSVKGSEASSDETTTLLRVKDQVYGPEDSIAIKSSQVTFWQNLRDDSKVTQAIKSKD